MHSRIACYFFDDFRFINRLGKMTTHPALQAFLNILNKRVGGHCNDWYLDTVKTWFLWRVSRFQSQAFAEICKRIYVRLNEGNVKRHVMDRIDSLLGQVAGKRLKYADLVA